MFKKILLMIFFIAFVSVGCATKNGKTDMLNAIIQKDKLTVGISYDSKPFGFRDSDGQIKGVEADLAREIARRILGSDKKVEFKQVSPQARMPMVALGEVDMVISTMTITPQRKKIIDFSIPYFVAGQAICVKKDSKIDSHDDLNNRNVIVVLGTTGERNLRDFIPNAVMQGYVNNSDALNAFKEGKDDAITTDDSILQGFIMENADYKILPIRLSKEPYGIALKKSRDAAEFKKYVDKVLGDIMLDGTLETIKDKWGVS